MLLLRVNHPSAGRTKAILGDLSPFPTRDPARRHLQGHGICDPPEGPRGITASKKYLLGAHKVSREQVYPSAPPVPRSLHNTQVGGVGNDGEPGLDPSSSPFPSACVAAGAVLEQIPGEIPDTPSSVSITETHQLLPRGFPFQQPLLMVEHKLVFPRLRLSLFSQKV